jgi:hypothetical protein
MTLCLCGCLETVSKGSSYRRGHSLRVSAIRGGPPRNCRVCDKPFQPGSAAARTCPPCRNGSTTSGPVTLCHCGCGAELRPGSDGRIRTFERGHLERVRRMVPCACGCGTLMPNIDGRGRRRQSLKGHGGSKHSKRSTYTLTCAECARTFEQGYGRPKFCPSCRSIPCACGCGNTVRRPNVWLPGHHRVGKPLPAGHRAAIARGGLGRRDSEETRLRKSLTYDETKHKFGRGSRQGWYCSTVTAKNEYYASSWELRRFEQLDEEGLHWTKDHGVRVPYTALDGRRRHYTPDIRVRSGQVEWFEEIKPANLVSYGNNPRKFDAARKIIPLVVITEKELNSWETPRA